jgi:Flp pilus assembly protein TadD
MAFAWRAKRGRLAIGFVVLYSSVMILFFVCDRYRLPVIPLLIMFAAYAAVRIYDMMRQKKLREAIPALAGLLLLAGFVNSNAYHLEKEEPVHQYYMLGLLAQQNGKHEDAVENFRHAAALGKPIRNLYLHWGTNEAALGRIENAKANFHKELQYHPDSYGALANLAETCLHERSLDSAMELSRRAIEIKPYEPSAYVTLGQSHYIRHDLPRADSVLAVGMERCGNRFRYGTYLLAGIRLERHDLVGAEKAYHSVLGAGEKVPAGYEPTFLMPTALTERVDAQILHGKALYGLGHVFAARRQIDSAAHYFELAIRKTPSLADAWADLGVARLQLHELALADTALRHALLLQPDNPLYLYNHGMILGASGKLDEARAAFERALALRPGFSPAENALALLRRLRTK